MDNKNFITTSVRVKVPATTQPGAPYTITTTTQGNRLERVIISTSTAGFTNDAGLRLIGLDGTLYPGMGSISDSNFAGKESYGALPPSGQVYEIPFSQKLAGPPYLIRFEFYNDGAGVLGVNVLIISSFESPAPYLPDHKKEIEESPAAK